MRLASLPKLPLPRRQSDAQRDHLRDAVFPELAERLRARRYHLEQVDLRWGVVTTETEGEEAKELLALKVCLDAPKQYLVGGFDVTRTMKLAVVEDAGLVIEAGLSTGVDAAILYPENLTGAFFDLSSGEARASVRLSGLGH